MAFLTSEGLGRVRDSIKRTAANSESESDPQTSEKQIFNHLIADDNGARSLD